MDERTVDGMDAEAGAGQPAPLPASLARRIPTTPQHYLVDGRFPDDAPVYLLRVATVREQQDMDFELMREVGVPVANDTQRDALLAAVEVLLPEEEQGGMRDGITIAFDPDAEADDREAVAERVNAFHRRASWEVPAYSQIIAQKSRYEERRTLLALEMFLEGQTTIADRAYDAVTKYGRNGRGRVDGDTIDTIPVRDRQWLGTYAIACAYLRPSQKKS